MKVSKTLRVLVGAVLLVVAVGAIWWVVGYSLGKTILAETGGGGAFRVAYGFRDSGVLQLLFLGALVLVVRALGGDAGGRWIRLAGVAGVAAVLAGGVKGDGVAVALLVLAAAAVAEAHAAEAVVTALIAGAVVAFAEALGTGLGTGHKLLVLALRDVFFFAPLLLGPELLDAKVWKKAD